MKRGTTGGVTSMSITNVSQRRWTSVHDQYKTIEILGQGTYGVVYKAEHKGSGELVAMKRCRLDAFREFGIPETTLREIALLRDLKHENIMTLHHVSCNTERLYLICEYLDLDLKKYIRSRPQGIPIRKVKEISYELFKGLAFCHGHRVVHRDLKPHNVLVSSDVSKVKIADFGLARSALAPGKTLTHEVITLWYRAPELLLGHCNYSSGVDIWSAGCIIAELLSLKPLYVGDSEIDTLFKIFRLLGSPKEEDWPEHSVVSWPQFPQFKGKEDPFGALSEHLDENGKNLLSQTFRFNSEKRISALEALQHPWLSEVRENAEAAGRPLFLAEYTSWDVDDKSTVPTSSSGDATQTSPTPSISSKGSASVSSIERENDPESESRENCSEKDKEITIIETDNSRSQKDVDMSDQKNEKYLNRLKEPKLLPPEKFHEVAKMAQRMKELEDKLREVEKQRFKTTTQNSSKSRPLHHSDPQRPPVDQVVSTRPTTATSSPGIQNDSRDDKKQKDVLIEHDNTRLGDCGANKKKENNTIHQPNAQFKPKEKPQGMGKEWEFFNRIRRSSLGSLIDRRRKKDQTISVVLDDGNRGDMKDMKIDFKGKDVTGSQVELKIRAEELIKAHIHADKSQQRVGIQRDEYKKDEEVYQQQQHRHSVPSTQGCEHGDVHRNFISTTTTQQPPTTQNLAENYVIQCNQSRHSLPSYQLKWKHSQHYQQPQPTDNKNSEKLCHQSDFPYHENDPYELHHHPHHHHHQQQHLNQIHAKSKRLRRSRQNPSVRQSMGDSQTIDDQNIRDTQGEGSSNLFQNNYFGYITRDRRVPPSSSHHRSTEDFSSYQNNFRTSVTSSGVPMSSLGLPVINSSSSSSFWGGRDIALDVECSFNWTKTHNDDKYRHHRGQRPYFQNSTHQGTTFQSTTSTNLLKKSSSYGGGSSSIRRINLKLAANASLFPMDSNKRQYGTSLSRESGCHDHLAPRFSSKNARDSFVDSRVNSSSSSQLIRLNDNSKVHQKRIKVNEVKKALGQKNSVHHPNHKWISQDHQYNNNNNVNTSKSPDIICSDTEESNCPDPYEMGLRRHTIESGSMRRRD